jgi:hypothetical protein
MTPETETVQKVAALASALNHLRHNRMEYMLVTILLYATGLGTTILTQAQGVCA